MKAILVLALIAIAYAATDKELFAEFKGKYQKVYGTETEESRRFAIFQSNMRKAERLTKINGAEFGVTKFSDLTSLEFKKYLNLNILKHREWAAALPKAQLPNVNIADVDWTDNDNPRGFKAVSSVKDQAQCGSCWAFSATAALESCMMIKNGDGVDVNGSPQQILDCCTAYDCGDGCEGGYPAEAINWGTSQNIATWDSYPYKASQGKCKTATKVAVPSGTCTFSAVGTGSETPLQTALQESPLSICIAADVLQTYSSGIIKGNSCKDSQVDHAVFLVALKNGVYTVKNSWGENWGERGFFRMVAGSNCLHLADEWISQALPN
jgi:cathepsin L